MTIGNYLVKRDTLACLFILIDCRHKPLQNDLEFINWAGDAGIPVSLVFTKADKISEAALKKSLELYRKTLLQTWEEVPRIFVTSAANQSGRDDILAFIEKTNRMLG
jgi:GTP-binding protein